MKTKFNFYKWVKPWPKRIKLFIQFFIGLVITVLLILKFFSNLNEIANNLPEFLSFVKRDSVFRIVGNGLAYSAGIELSYMLFTKGPDEAVDPLILGFASAILIIISDNNLQPSYALALVVFVFSFAIYLLFYIRNYLLDQENEEDEEDQNED